MQGNKRSTFAVDVGRVGGFELLANVPGDFDDVFHQQTDVGEDGHIDVLQHIVCAVAFGFHSVGGVDQPVAERVDVNALRPQWRNGIRCLSVAVPLRRGILNLIWSEDTKKSSARKHFARKSEMEIAKRALISHHAALYGAKNAAESAAFPLNLYSIRLPPTRVSV